MSSKHEDWDLNHQKPGRHEGMPAIPALKGQDRIPRA